ncbi:MAG: beta-N-acetylhexosaminidase, partial [Myxococcota bacterium]
DDGDVVLAVEPGGVAESYVLDVTADGVTIVGADAAGVFWGTQTLRQLVTAEGVPAVHVEDAPRFAWRGLMIDVARHFFTVEDLERQIDLMALHKLNRLHLHLTDDQGWRIEIESWPDLTAIGGSTEVGGGPGGFYTQGEYVALVEYAAERQIIVVPEIDFPGHSHAALASYAELNESGEREELYTGAGVISTPLWLEGEATAGFVEDVWREVAALTPGEWVHVGGDEAIDATPEQYAAFVTWLQGVVAAEGKTMIGWDEIGDVALTPPFVAQWWVDHDNAQDAIARGGMMIASPAHHAYLDMVHDAEATFGQTWAGPVGVRDAYDWEPLPPSVDEDDVLGVEGALWTEYVDTVERMDFMVWPRLAAHAEIGWTPQALRDWEGFRARLGEHGARLDALGVGYYRSPEVDWAE